MISSAWWHWQLASFILFLFLGEDREAYVVITCCQVIAGYVVPAVTLFKVLFLWENSQVVNLSIQFWAFTEESGSSNALSWSHLGPAMISCKETFSSRFGLQIWSCDYSYWSFFGFRLLCATVKVVDVYLLISSSYLFWFSAHRYLSCENHEKNFNI